jgi:hypothetical protein
VSENRIVTRYEDQPGTTYIGQRPAVGILPDGREIRIGYRVTGSYWRDNDVEGVVIGWNPDHVVVEATDSMGGCSLELGPENILTIEATR